MFTGGSRLSLHDCADPQVLIERADLNGMTVGRVTSTGHDVRVVEPLGLSLVVPFSGEVIIEGRFGKLVAHPGQAILAPPGIRQTRVKNTKADQFVGVPIIIPQISLEEGSVLSSLEEAVGLDATKDHRHAQIIRLVEILSDELSEQHGLFSRSSAADGWRNLLLECLTEVLVDAKSIRRGALLGNSQPHRLVRAAKAYIHNHLSEVLTIADLARLMDVSTRTLQSAFRSVLDMAPNEYIARLRLLRARELLCSEDGPATVLDVCFACGINHAGRFAVSYRTLYGEHPSETLRRR